MSWCEIDCPNCGSIFLNAIDPLGIVFKCAECGTTVGNDEEYFEENIPIKKRHRKDEDD